MPEYLTLMLHQLFKCISFDSPFVCVTAAPPSSSAGGSSSKDAHRPSSAGSKRTSTSTSTDPPHHRSGSSKPSSSSAAPDNNGTATAAGGGGGGGSSGGGKLTSSKPHVSGKGKGEHADKGERSLRGASANTAAASGGGGGGVPASAGGGGGTPEEQLREIRVFGKEALKEHRRRKAVTDDQCVSILKKVCVAGLFRCFEIWPANPIKVGRLRRASPGARH